MIDLKWLLRVRNYWVGMTVTIFSKRVFPLHEMVRVGLGWNRGSKIKASTMKQEMFSLSVQRGC